MTSAFAFLDPTSNTVELGNRFKEESKLNTGININKHVNENIGFQHDIIAYKDPEFFAMPDDTIAKKAGDCEDLSAIVIATLNGTGQFTKNQVRMAVGKYVIDRIVPAMLFSGFVGSRIKSSVIGGLIGSPLKTKYHAWTEVQIDDKWYILDPTDGGVWEKDKNQNYVPEVFFYQTKFEFARD